MFVKGKPQSSDLYIDLVGQTDKGAPGEKKERKASHRSSPQKATDADEEA